MSDELERRVEKVEERLDQIARDVREVRDNIVGQRAVRRVLMWLYGPAAALAGWWFGRPTT